MTLKEINMIEERYALQDHPLFDSAIFIGYKEDWENFKKIMWPYATRIGKDEMFVCRPDKSSERWNFFRIDDKLLSKLLGLRYSKMIIDASISREDFEEVIFPQLHGSEIIFINKPKEK